MKAWKMQQLFDAYLQLTRGLPDAQMLESTNGGKFLHKLDIMRLSERQKQIHWETMKMAENGKKWWVKEENDKIVAKRAEKVQKRWKSQKIRKMQEIRKKAERTEIWKIWNSGKNNEGEIKKDKVEKATD